MKSRAIAFLILLTTLLLFVDASATQAQERSRRAAIKRLVALQGANATGIVKISYRAGTVPHQRFEVSAVGLLPRRNYQLMVNGILLDSGSSDNFGVLEFLYRSHISKGSRGEFSPLPAGLTSVLAIENVALVDDEQAIVLTAKLPVNQRGKLQPQFTIPDTNVQAGQTVTLNVAVSDPNGDSITLSIRCDRGNFITVKELALIIAPKDADIGRSFCTVTASDQFGLSSNTTFTVNVLSVNRPPSIATIPDQIVRVGESKTLVIQANDPDGNIGLRFSIESGLSYIFPADTGNGTFTLRITVPPSETAGGRITVRVSDLAGLSAQTSFNLIVRKGVGINSVVPARPRLFISGFGFGLSGAQVIINGQDVSRQSIGQSDTAITLKGSRRKLNLRAGANQIQVISEGIASNTFVLSLLVE
ncbi:MAG: hypothetical protein AB1489_20740 [Acidobacteriota bacterium]